MENECMFGGWKQHPKVFHLFNQQFPACKYVRNFQACNEEFCVVRQACIGESPFLPPLSSRFSIHSLQLCLLSNLLASSSSLLTHRAFSVYVHRNRKGILCAYEVSSSCRGIVPLEHLKAGKHWDCPAHPSSNNWISMCMRNPGQAAN